MAELALRVIKGRWKLLLLRHLSDGTRRFSDLQKAINGISQKVLTEQLRDLEADGVLIRTIYPEVPPRVDYALTDLGRDLLPVLDRLHTWGEGCPSRKARRRRDNFAQGGEIWLSLIRDRSGVRCVGWCHGASDI